MFQLIKFLIRFIICKFVSFFVFLPKTINPKTILLIRLDWIGDYLLFRNFIEALKKSKHYQGYKITLLGNVLWRDLAENLDCEYIDEFIWLNREKFHKNPFYRFRKFKEINKNGYEIVLNPVYSREFFYSDWIVNSMKAQEKIGSIGDLTNIKKWQKNISDNYYTKLLPAKNEIMFEFYRNKEFLENLLQEKLSISKPHLLLKKMKCNIKLPENYAVIFPGVNAKWRRWPAQSFAGVGKHLLNKYGFGIVICGGHGDEKESVVIESLIGSKKVLNLCGKTTLIELAFVISNGKILISNDTCAPHLAISMDLASIVIYNGNHYGRFTPYPPEITDKYHIIYHPKIEKDPDGYKRNSNNSGNVSSPDISEIKVENVLKKIDKILANEQSQNIRNGFIPVDKA